LTSFLAKVSCVNNRNGIVSRKRLVGLTIRAFREAGRHMATMCKEYLEAFINTDDLMKKYPGIFPADSFYHEFRKNAPTS
jgi:hypothetical protein